MIMLSLIHGDIVAGASSFVGFEVGAYVRGCRRSWMQTFLDNIRISFHSSDHKVWPCNFPLSDDVKSNRQNCHQVNLQRTCPLHSKFMAFSTWIHQSKVLLNVVEFKRDQHLITSFKFFMTHALRMKIKEMVSRSRMKVNSALKTHMSLIVKINNTMFRVLD